MDLQLDYDYQHSRRSKVPNTKQNRFSVLIGEPSSTQSQAHGSKKATISRNEHRVWKNTKENSFNPNSSYVSTPIGKSSTESQAQGSKKAMMPRKELRERENTKEDSLPLNSSYVSIPTGKYSPERTEDLQAWEFITKDDTFFGFTVNDSYDSPPHGESSTQSQAHGNKKTRMRRKELRARKRRSRKTSYESNSATTSSNNNLRALFKMWITMIMNNFDSIIENMTFNIVNCFTLIQSMVFDVYTSLGVLSFWMFRPLRPSTETTITETNLNMNRANMQKASSWIIVFTFPWCLLLSNYKHSLLTEQSSLSVWLALFGMVNFTVFLSSLFLMVISGAHFTRMQITVLLISAMVMNTYITGSTSVPFYVSVLGIQFAGSFAGAQEHG